MKEIWEIIKLIVPLIIELIKLLKGQSPEDRTETVRNIRGACSGVGCPPDLKK